MTEADAEHTLSQRVEALEEGAEVGDAGVVAVGVAAAAGDHEAIVFGEVVVLRQLAGSHPEDVPRLSLLRQHSDEDAEEPAVSLPDILGVLRAQQNSESPLPH